MITARFIAPFGFLLIIIASVHFLTDRIPTPVTPRPFSGAMASLDDWTRQRAYPAQVIPDRGYASAFEAVKTTSVAKSGAAVKWQPLGPCNIGGRTISIAINPLNANTIYAGSASGGLWRSYSGGNGIAAWEQVPTKHPVLGVNCIAIQNSDSNTIFIGTGEVYGYQNSIGGLSIRTTRGSYGIGILKTTNGGISWMKSLDWSYQQRRGVLCMRFHPVNTNVLFAGTTEGIFKTTNGGAQWTQLTDVIMVTDLLIHPQNPSLMLAACGNLDSYGKGVYRSTDGGNNWNKISSVIPAAFAGKIHFDHVRTQPDIVYASVGMGSATGAGTTLCKSTDFGNTWSVVSQNDHATYQGWYSHFVIPHPSDLTKVLCGGIDMWKSSDAGVSFTRKTNWAAWYFGVVPVGGPEGPANYSHADHHAYAIDPVNPNLVYVATDGGIFKTTDFGETFSGCNGGYQTTQFYKRFGVSRRDTTRMIGGMQDNATAVWEGTTAWRRVLGGDGCCTQISPSSTDTMYGSSQYLAVSRSSNRGLNWTSASPPAVNEAFNAPFLIAPSNAKILYSGGDKMYKSTNAGVNWSVLNNNTVINGDPVLSIAISYTNPDTVFITTAPNSDRAQVYRSGNGGVSWTKITGSLPDRYPVDITVDPKNSSTVYVVFSGFGTSHLFKSTNAGASWADIGNGLPDVPTSAVFIDPLNGAHIFVGNDLGVFASFDDGNTWFPVLEGFDDCALVMDLSYSPGNRMLVAATHGKGVYQIPLNQVSPTGLKAEYTAKQLSVELTPNYPNPFNASTTLNFSLPQRSRAKLALYDIQGRQITVLADRVFEAGKHSGKFSATGPFSLPAGVYVFRIETEFATAARKIVYMP